PGPLRCRGKPTLRSRRAVPGGWNLRRRCTPPPPPVVVLESTNPDSAAQPIPIMPAVAGAVLQRSPAQARAPENGSRPRRQSTLRAPVGALVAALGGLALYVRTA